ncbi:MAG TPA: ABC transporter permease subunit [Streptosporangiaceae bacterium]|nr:ABC transporter permease subunit [Streptosporangiaceae bacterium]
MTTIAPYRAPQQAGRDGFWQLVHAEWTKFRTMRGWVIAVIAAAVLIDVLGLFLVNAGTTQCGGPCIPAVPTGPGGEAVLDSFYFVRQPLPSNGSLTVRVTSLTGKYEPEGGPVGPPSAVGLTARLMPWSKAGIIIKQSTRQGSAYAAMMVTGQHGVRMQYDYTGDVAGLPGHVSAASPRWLRLTRSGATITGYDSADGRNWTKVAVVRLPGLQGTVQAGLFATSPYYFQSNFPSYAQSGGGTSPSRATGTFDHVSLRGGRHGSTWAGQLVGANPRLESMPGLGFHHAGDSFTIAGSGDIAPIVGGAANTNYDTGTIADHLVAVIFGLIVLVVIGAMFVTAEYRRGMIRITLAASPRRGRVLAAKAVVIGLVCFALGLPATALAVFAGSRISRSHGVYVLPVSWATDLQVIAGTAALLAVAAVLAVAVGTIARRSVVAVAAVIVVFVLPYILGDTSVVSSGVSEWMFRVTPVAAFAVEQSVPQYHQVVGQYGPPEYFALAPWAGLAVLCGYAAAALAVAYWLLRRRDA